MVLALEIHFKWCISCSTVVFVGASVGFLPDLTAQLVKEADIHIHKDKDRYIVLMWDEKKTSTRVSLLALLMLGRLITT